MLSWENEGVGLAHWLAGRGVSAFVLKYRLVDTGHTREEFERALAAMGTRILAAEGRDDRPTLLPGIDGRAIDRAVDDGRRAVRLLRQRAGQLGIDPGRLAMIGFSAGAIVTVQAAVSDDLEARPNLAVAVFGGALAEPVPNDAPPAMFIGAADDPLGSHLLAVDAAWRNAGLPAELHLFEQGGHGFGVNRSGLPVDAWPEQLWSWLESHGFTGG
jgi:dienelactone hydrolase